MSIDITEESILNALHRAPRDNGERVLESLGDPEPKGLPPSETAEPKHWAAAELLAMPPAQRDAILEAAAIPVPAISSVRADQPRPKQWPDQRPGS